MLKNLKILRKFKDLKLAKKLNLILIFVFLVNILISGTSLSIFLQQRAQSEVANKVSSLSEIINVMGEFPDQNRNFIPVDQLQVILDQFRNNSHSQDYNYILLRLNKINLKDDKFNTYIFEQFSKRSTNTSLSGFHNFPEGRSFYIARCLRNYSSNLDSCLIQKNTVFVNIVYVTTSKVFAATRQFWPLTAIILFNISAVGIINLLLNRTIIKPIVQISKDARLVSTGKADVDFEQCYKDEKRSKDEIVSLVASFNRMNSSLKIAKEIQKKEKRNN